MTLLYSLSPSRTIGIFFGMNLTNNMNDHVNLIGMGMYALYKARVLYNAYIQA